MKPRALALVPLAATALAALPTPLHGHAVVHPAVSVPAAYEKYVLRVPNERDVPTVRVELEFPAPVHVVSFADVPGWDLTVERDGDGRITRAVWTGELPVDRFVEFPFVAVNPDEEARLAWPAWQTYAGGERVGWTGPEGSETPASTTTIEAGDGGPGWATILGGAALAVALVALGLGLRPAAPRT